MKLSTVSRSLMFAGLIPFIAGTIAIALKLDSWWIINDIAISFAFYALAIASFMSGTHWAVAQLLENRTDLLFHSNLMVLLPWIALLTLGDGSTFYFFLAFVFFKQYLLDRKLTSQGVFGQPYLRDRRIVTTTVCLSMLFVAGINFY
ncbi:MAG: hypothetical protein ACJAQ6_000050 [Arenicella sp.]|jgi:hypothetical protein